jgi:hypothetical protein
MGLPGVFVCLEKEGESENERERERERERNGSPCHPNMFWHALCDQIP